MTQLEQGVPVDAVEELQVKLRFAELSLRNGDWDLAASEFSAALERAATLPLRRFVHEAASGKARAEEATGRLEKAIESYEWLLSEPQAESWRRPIVRAGRPDPGLQRVR